MKEALKDDVKYFEIPSSETIFLSFKSEDLVIMQIGLYLDSHYMRHENYLVNPNDNLHNSFSKENKIKIFKETIKNIEDELKRHEDDNGPKKDEDDKKI